MYCNISIQLNIHTLFIYRSKRCLLLSRLLINFLRHARKRLDKYWTWLNYIFPYNNQPSRLWNNLWCVSCSFIYRPISMNNSTYNQLMMILCLSRDNRSKNLFHTNYVSFFVYVINMKLILIIYRWGKYRVQKYTCKKPSDVGRRWNTIAITMFTHSRVRLFVRKNFTAFDLVEILNQPDWHPLPIWLRKIGIYSIK